MLTSKEAKKLLLDNFTDEDGDLDISNIDLSDFEGNVYLSGWKVKRNLFQGFQDIGKDLYQYNQKVGGCLYQDNDKSDECCEPKYKMTLKEFWESKKLLAIHCSTLSQAKKFMVETNKLKKFCIVKKEFEKLDKYTRDNKWQWIDYKEKTSYTNDELYGSIYFVKKEGYKILEFDEIDFENETKGENKQMELKYTITMMTSDNYKERFKAEYYQVKIRYDKLHSMIDKWDKGELTFIPTCPRETYNFQLRAMKEYLDILVIRAKIENIDLGE